MRGSAWPRVPLEGEVIKGTRRPNDGVRRRHDCREQVVPPTASTRASWSAAALSFGSQHGSMPTSAHEPTAVEPPAWLTGDIYGRRSA